MRKNVHPIEDLFALLDQFKSYPHGVIPIPGCIPGTAFFPGGFGLWHAQPDELPPPMPVGGSVIVGHNFDSEAGFERSFHHPGENLKGATWRNLVAFLQQVGIPPEQCFFTNAYVGLRAGARAMGAFAGAQDPHFVRWCRNFLLEQLRLIQPRLILTLGAHVPRFLAPPFSRIKDCLVRRDATSHTRRARGGVGVSKHLRGCATPRCGRGAHPSCVPLTQRQVSTLWEPAG